MGDVIGFPGSEHVFYLPQQIGVGDFTDAEDNRWLFIEFDDADPIALDSETAEVLVDMLSKVVRAIQCR